MQDDFTATDCFLFYLHWQTFAVVKEQASGLAATCCFCSVQQVSWEYAAPKVRGGCICVSKDELQRAYLLTVQICVCGCRCAFCNVRILQLQLAWMGGYQVSGCSATNRADSALDCTVAVYNPWEQQKHGFSRCIIRPSWRQRWNFKYLDPKCVVRNTVSVLLTWQSCLCDGFLAKPCLQPDNRELFS